MVVLWGGGVLMSEVPLHISKNPALVPYSRLVTRAL